MHHLHRRHSFPHRLRGITSASRMRGQHIADPTGAPAILVPEAEDKFLTGGISMTKACSSSSSRMSGSSYGSGLPTPATIWPDRCGWPRRSGASFWSSGQAQNFRHSRPRISSIGRPTRKQQRLSTTMGCHPLGRTSGS
ncbi:UNVERIFIED_CONTAM: hypothetical protein Sradi_1316600 [Sesamum radiatum]|uniref:Uncharacterized protein n=1 Tax=Sesamum radiatum TaxID=300843 RepID=A0AAW2UP76_SESRA